MCFQQPWLDEEMMCRFQRMIDISKPGQELELDGMTADEYRSGASSSQVPCIHSILLSGIHGHVT